MEKKRGSWSPIKGCDCTVTVHKKCWDKWQTISQVCIICRQDPNKIQVGLVAVYIYPNYPPASNTYRFFLIVTAALLTLIALSMTASRTISIKDEL